VCGDPADCNDNNANVHPNASELCDDGFDNDCDGLVDYDDEEDCVCEDADSDGHAAEFCGGDDCDDTRPGVYPGAVERCNGIDDDCDGEVDEPDAVDAPTWYLDDDGDGFGDPEVSVVACAPPADHVADDTDCDDEDEAVTPGAVEVCNEVDDDCAEGVDVDAVDAPTWYLDGDGDGFGTVGTAVVACAPTTGQVAAWGDCDDSRDDTYPGAAWGDSGFDCMRDADEDGYGDRDATSPVVPGTDCADDDDARHPAADEVFYDGIDQDCDDGSDYDADEDGYDSEDHGGTDCYDDNAEARPGATDYHAADRGDGSWDYDCDEAETRQSTAVTPTTCYSLEEYTELGWYWDGPGVPGCGETAQWELAVCECEWISFGLGEYWNCGVRTWDDEDAAQACR